MSNHFLKPISPLGADQARIDKIGTVTISENIDHSLASVATRLGKAKPFATAAKKALKLSLPGPGESITKGDFTVFWSAPEQWFVEARLESHEDISSILKRDFKDTASITEQSGGWCRFDLAGDDCVALLQRLCAVDSAAMKPGDATRTVIEHIGAFVLCHGAGNSFSIYGPRSSADSLHHALVTAANSIA